MSRLIKAVAMALVLALTFSLCGFAGECGRIRERVLRLHILANSDSEEDQQLKLQVRDAVVAASAGLFDGAEDESEALERAREQLPLLEKTARQIIADAGYDYDVEISLCNMYFTTRFYDGVNGGESVTLPAGMYDAVRIVIGEGAGRNWWCVVFPPLCVSAAQESGDSATLDDVLDPEQEEIVTEPGKYEVRFKIVEIFEDLCHRISGWFGQPESTPA